MPRSTGRVFRKAILPSLAAAALGVVAFASPAQAATYTVTNTNDAGGGSLRDALEQSGLASDADTIEFDIAGAGPHTIAVASDLPPVTDEVTIDGYSQDDADPPTATEPATLKVAIDASNASRGLDIGGDGAEVRGLAIHSAQVVGVFIDGRRAKVAGNHIGTDVAGTAPLGNGESGIEIFGGGTVIGGQADADRNVIAGSESTNVRVNDGSLHVVRGNRIGTNAAGTAGLDSLQTYGIMVDSSLNVVSDNLISAEFVGLEVLGDANIVRGNLIGTDVTGSAPIDNTLGLNVEGGDYNLIGGTGAGDANVIGNSLLSGLQIESGSPEDAEEEAGPAVGNLVRGNFIGTDATATVALPNGVGYSAPGVAIALSNDNTIGGTDAGAGNVIAASDGAGLVIAGADDNRVRGNWIGTTPAGAANLGNRGSGVDILDGSGNRIGDTGANTGNTIAHNGRDGVTVQASTGIATGNAILRNAIFANGTGRSDLAIDLAADGLTANDARDTDTGANALQNSPVITAASAGGKVVWTLDAAASTSYRLELFATPRCDASGSAEPPTYLGSVTAVTDTTGHAGGVKLTNVTAGHQVTATATLLNASGEVRETSEHSPCVTVT
jgi:trimeric autotransporter adhesin